MGILEKIQDIENEIKRTQKNKATEYHLGLLKAKLAKYRVQLLEGSKTKSEKGEGFDVMKSGDARVVMIGFPSVGKSTLLNKLTTTESIAAAYEFTTLTCVPGKFTHNGANIQLLDLPGIIEGASQELLEAELEAVGIRLNQRFPNVSFKIKKAGGISFNATLKLHYIDQKMVHNILHDYKIFNADVVIREDITVEQFIDVVLGNRRYIDCIYCYNKIDQITMEEIDRLAHEPDTVVVSCEQDLNMDYLVERIWKKLNLMRVYTKKRGDLPDFEDGLIVRSGATIEHVCHAVHRSLAESFRYALVWGTSTKHNPQRVGISHQVHDEDVVQVVKK
ncbi:developmentally-regulated GTP-binding protein 2 [Phycomyces blakesleeanus]